jgi:hypothetical protein
MVHTNPAWNGGNSDVPGGQAVSAPLMAPVIIYKMPCYSEVEAFPTPCLTPVMKSSLTKLVYSTKQVKQIHMPLYRSIYLNGRWSQSMFITRLNKATLWFCVVLWKLESCRFMVTVNDLNWLCLKYWTHIFGLIYPSCKLNVFCQSRWLYLVCRNFHLVKEYRINIIFSYYIFHLETNGIYRSKRGHVFIDKLEGVKGATKNNKAKDRQCNDLKIKDKKTRMVNTTLQRKLKIEPSEHQ